MDEKNNLQRKEEFKRFGLNFRIQHIVLMLSTVLLIVSGLPLKFYEAGWAQVAMSIMGGPEGARRIHHLAAIGLISIGIYHLGYIIFSRTGRRDFKELIPKKKDFIDFKNQILYFFRKIKTKPMFGRFSFIEKFDYWAVYWGFAIMIGSGLIMWMFQGHFHPFGFDRINLLFASGMIDNYVHAISREAHSDEAFLATMAIIIWHFYNVHFNPDKFPGSKVWLTGKLSREEMEKEHPLELEEIERNTELKNGKETSQEIEASRDSETRDIKESDELKNEDEKLPEKEINPGSDTGTGNKKELSDDEDKS